MKIDKLTEEQVAKISEYRDRYFRQATSTTAADRPRAEAAARRMSEIAGIKIEFVHWVENPVDRDSLSDSLRASLRASLWASLSASLWATGWLAFYTYVVEVIGIECNKEHRELLKLHNDIAMSCFAIWIVPGAVILCERPETVKIVDGNLIDLKWRKNG